MSNVGFKIELFNPLEATEETWDSVLTFIEDFDRELLPNDPPTPREIVRQAIIDPPPDRKSVSFLMYLKDGTLVGMSGCGWTIEGTTNFEANKHVVWVDITIKKEYRRKGLGTVLFQRLVQEIGPNHSVIQSWSSLESGHNFLQKLSFKKVMEGAQNRLYLEKVDWALMESWIAQGLEKAPDVTLEMFEEVSENDIDSYTALFTETMNQQPFGEMEGRHVVTPELRRIAERRRREWGINWHTLISREGNGVISGLTEFFYDPKESYQIKQNLTGVQERFRGRGLGKLLKAKMLFFMRETYPSVKFISTGNANDNAPMLAINNQMGFQKTLEGMTYKTDAVSLKNQLGLS